MEDNFKAGEIVEYSTPLNEEEAKLRFKVIEDREIRLFVELVCDEYLKPTFCFAISEFTKA